MNRFCFIMLLLGCLGVRADQPTNITSAVDDTCVDNEPNMVLANPTLYVFTNGVFSYHGYPTNIVNVINNWPQNAQGQGYSACATNELGAEAHGIYPYLDDAPQPGLDVSFTITAQAFEIHAWDQSDDYCDLYDEDDGTLTTINLGDNSPPQWYLVQYASRQTRHLRLYFECNAQDTVPGVIFNGIDVGQGDSLAADTNWTPGMLVEGDSLDEGWNPDTGKWFYDSYTTLAGFLTNGGSFHAMADGIGGSGFLANGYGTNYAARFFSDVRPYTNLFHFFVIQASINDGGFTNPATHLPYTDAQYFAAVTNLIGLARTSLPGKEIAMLGIPANWEDWYQNNYNSPGSYDYDMNTNAMNACQVMGIPYFDALDQNGGYGIIPGNSTYQSEIDETHLTQAGYQLVANFLNSEMAQTFSDYPVEGTNQSNQNTNQSGSGGGSGSDQPGQLSGSLSLNVTNYGALGDAVEFSVNTVSNSTVVSVAGTNTFSAADIGKVIEVFRAGPWLTYSNWGVVVTQQDIICLVTNVSEGTNLSLSIPCGWTMNTYGVVGRNNGPCFQAAVNAATGIVAQGTNATINVPPGRYLMVSSNVLNANYVMYSMSDTHPALTISSGGITLLGQSATNTILMGCGAGMEHLVGQSLTWINPGYAPYVPMRDTLVYCSGPVANNQYPLVFQNLTFDGGLTNGAQPYNYWTPIQGNGEGWDTTHHAVADSDALVTYQMNLVKEFTNCTFQHWRGEILICWTSCITNAMNDIADCTFYDGNATADNMYYGQHIHGCTFNQLGKVMEYYQANATLPMLFEDNLWTNISPNNNYALTVVGATVNATPPSFTVQNNTFHDESGINALQFSPACNVSVVSNYFSAGGNGLTFTYAGEQPSDGTADPVMTNFLIADNTFGCPFPIGDEGFPIQNMTVSNNTGLYVSITTVYANNIVLANNTGVQLANAYDDQGGPYALNSISNGITGGQYMIDELNNSWATPTEPYDGGDYTMTNFISYGNGRVHLLKSSGANFYLDNIYSNCIPTGATLTVNAQTWTGLNVTNFYLSAVSPGEPITITNNAAPTTFYWNGSAWSTTPLTVAVQFTASPVLGASRLAVAFKSPSTDSKGVAIKGWKWNFGDGTTDTGQNLSHTYTNTGPYAPTLTVSNALGQLELSSGLSITVTNPVVKFTASLTNALPRLTIEFKAPDVDSGGNKITNWFWEFGDGTTSAAQNPSHTYANLGNYSPALAVKNVYGLSPSSSGPGIKVSDMTVQFTASSTNGAARLKVAFKCPSSDGVGVAIKSWHWSFGDGATSIEQNPSHTYTNVGPYIPTLTISNILGLFQTGSGSAVITVTNPAIKFTASRTNACPGLTIQFKSPNVDSGKNKITSWFWSFGDGATSTEENPSHAYTNPITYHPVLNVTNEFGLTPTSSGPAINVANPTMQFTASKTNGVSRLTVAFKCPSSDSVGVAIKSWHWSFGDGTTSAEQNPSHTYTNVLRYVPVLTVSNALGLFPSSSGPAITVTNPIIKFTASPTNGAPPLAVQFKSPNTDSGGNKIANWFWKFGDGTVSTIQDPSHIYTNSGTYAPVLIVTNECGLSSTNSGVIIVSGNVADVKAQFILGQSPILSLAVSGENVILAWPTNNVTYTLQSTTDMVIWNSVLPLPAVNNGQNVVTNPILSGQMFFRLELQQ